MFLVHNAACCCLLVTFDGLIEVEYVPVSLQNVQQHCNVCCYASSASDLFTCLSHNHCVCMCVCVCECLCMCVCVLVWVVTRALFDKGSNPWRHLK